MRYVVVLDNIDGIPYKREFENRSGLNKFLNAKKYALLAFPDDTLYFAKQHIFGLKNAFFIKKDGKTLGCVFEVGEV